MNNAVKCGIEVNPQTEEIIAPLTLEEFNSIVDVCKEKDIYAFHCYRDYYTLAFKKSCNYRYPENREDVVGSILNTIDYTVKNFI